MKLAIRRLIPLCAAFTLALLSVRAQTNPAPQTPHQEKAAPSRLEQNDARLSKLETYIIGRINDERRARNLRLLATDSLLADVARAHSGEMRDANYFSHESPTPALHHPLDRYLMTFRDTPHLIAENIYRQWSSRPQRITQGRAEDAHVALMNSPGHRENILLPNALRVGVGITSNSNGDLWITEMFSRP